MVILKFDRVIVTAHLSERLSISLSHRLNVDLKENT